MFLTETLLCGTDTMFEGYISLYLIGFSIAGTAGSASLIEEHHDDAVAIIHLIIVCPKQPSEYGDTNILAVNNNLRHFLVATPLPLPVDYCTYNTCCCA